MKSTIAITGAGGFIGRHISFSLKKMGYRIIPLTYHAKADGEQINILSFRSLLDIFEKYSINIFVHLAGLSSVDKGTKSPYKTLKTNILGTLNILEACRIYKVSKIIISSTAHVYGNANIPTNESEKPEPTRPYETSKACSDLVALSYAHTYKLPIIIPRFSNIYGPGDKNIQRIVPKTILAILRGDNPELWDGNAIREYIYIDDVAKAYELLVDCDMARFGINPIVNFGSDFRISARSLIEMIVKLTGKSVSIIQTVDKRSDEIPEQRMNSHRALEIFGWKATTDLVTGLTKTVAWYKKQQKSKHFGL